jgi:hypothetical protein
MEKNKSIPLPANCPLCGDAIEVTQIKCAACGSSINGSFTQSEFAVLPLEYQKFIIVFLHERGNIKGVEKELGISYPTIIKMLDNINNMLKYSASQTPLSRKEILDAIEKGEMSVKDATHILKHHK